MGVTKILLTNRNHSRAANVVRTRTDAKTLIHRDDAAHAEARARKSTVNFPRVNGSVPWRSSPFPVNPPRGGTPWPERRLLIVGDAVIGNPPGQCGLLREKVMDDPAHLKASVRKLLDLEFDTLLLGDGVSILHDAKARLKELVATFPDGVKPGTGKANELATKRLKGCESYL